MGKGQLRQSLSWNREFRLYPKDNAKSLRIFSLGEESPDQICLLERTQWFHPREQIEGGKSCWRDTEAHLILPRVADEETNTQRGEAICPQRHSSAKQRSPDSNLSSSQSRAQLCSTCTSPTPMGAIYRLIGLLATKNLEEILLWPLPLHRDQILYSALKRK